jgi:transposase
VLSVDRGQRIFLAAGPTDMRKAFDGLSGLVREELGRNPMSGELFVFCNAARNRLKILLFEGAGLWVLAKRLERGTFAWPAASASGRRTELSPEELALLLGGLDARELSPRRWKRAHVA